jgi:hypothetical protein
MAGFGWPSMAGFEVATEAQTAFGASTALSVLFKRIEFFDHMRKFWHESG